MSAAHDLVIADAVVVTMDGEGSVLRDAWVAVRDGRVAEVGTGRPPAAARTIDARGGIVHPGYVSAHQHTMDTLMRSRVTPGLGFFDWLFGAYYAAVLAHEPADAATAAALAGHDLARAGVTTAVDVWGVGDPATARALDCFVATTERMRRSGLRWIVAPMVSDRVPEAWADEVEAVAHGHGVDLARLVSSTADARGFADDLAAALPASDALSLWLGPELPEMATDELLAFFAEATAAPRRGFATHLCASEASAAGTDGVRAVDRLAAHGLLDGRALGAHLSEASPGDLATLAAHGVGAAHCPSASMLGGARASAAARLVEAGIATGLGFDNASLGTTSDMVEEQRRALLFDGAAGTGARRLGAADVFRMATIDGARAIGRADELGSIEPGKLADLVVVDTAGAHWAPASSPVEGIVWRQRADDIVHVLVAGEPVVEDGRPCRPPV